MTTNDAFLINKQAGDILDFKTVSQANSVMFRAKKRGFTVISKKINIIDTVKKKPLTVYRVYFLAAPGEVYKKRTLNVELAANSTVLGEFESPEQIMKRYGFTKEEMAKMINGEELVHLGTVYTVDFTDSFYRRLAIDLIVKKNRPIGYTVCAVADIIGCKRSNIEMILVKAKKKLKRKILLDEKINS